MTIADFVAMPEDEFCRWELLEGNLTMAPSPTPAHSYASTALVLQLARQLPTGWVVIHDVDVDLQLAPPDQPGSARRPDLVVVERSEMDRVRTDGGLLRADEVVLAVELVSPGSRRTDRVIKHGQYADAGIPHY
jgi:Uma2 family endonuclease